MTREIALAGGQSVSNGDGILLDGRTLYGGAKPGEPRREGLALSKSEERSHRPNDRSSGFDVPTTIAEHGSRLYAVNARFSTSPTPSTKYWVTQVKK